MILPRSPAEPCRPMASMPAPGSTRWPRSSSPNTTAPRTCHWTSISRPRTKRSSSPPSAARARGRGPTVDGSGPSDFHDFAPPRGGALPAYGFDASARLDALVEKLQPEHARPEDVPLDLDIEDEDQALEEPTVGGAFAPP